MYTNTDVYTCPIAIVSQGKRKIHTDADENAGNSGSSISNDAVSENKTLLESR